jgi:hypothetical protein
VTLASGGSSIANEFGNFRGVLTGTITGSKFLDANGNGVRDPGESGLPGVTITRTATINDPVGANLSVVTDAQGNFAFANVPFGNFTLTETVPAGFAQTAPPPPGTSSGTINFAQRTSAGHVFGNRPLGGTVSGVKFNDANGNGARDSGEAGHDDDRRVRRVHLLERRGRRLRGFGSRAQRLHADGTRRTRDLRDQRNGRSDHR